MNFISSMLIHGFSICFVLEVIICSLRSFATEKLWHWILGEQAETNECCENDRGPFCVCICSAIIRRVLIFWLKLLAFVPMTKKHWIQYCCSGKFISSQHAKFCIIVILIALSIDLIKWFKKAQIVGIVEKPWKRHQRWWQIGM